MFYDDSKLVFAQTMIKTHSMTLFFNDTYHHCSVSFDSESVKNGSQFEVTVITDTGDEIIVHVNTISIIDIQAACEDYLAKIE